MADLRHEDKPYFDKMCFGIEKMYKLGIQINKRAEGEREEIANMEISPLIKFD